MSKEWTEKEADDTMFLLEEAGTVCVVDLEALNVDRAEYQRELRPHHKKISREFDPRACHPLIVGRRPDKSLWVIDGQQRRQALLRMGIKRWRAVVFNTDGPETEAKIFSICGGARGTTKPLSKGEVIRAMIAAKDPLVIEVKNAVDEAGLKWKTSTGNSARWPDLSCHTSLLTIARQYGPPVLERALKLINKTWPQEPSALKAEIVWSVGTLLGLHPKVDDERFARLLSKVPSQTIVNGARAEYGGWKLGHAYKIIVRRYNWKLTSSRIDERPLMAIGLKGKEDKKAQEKAGEVGEESAVLVEVLLEGGEEKNGQ